MEYNGSKMRLAVTKGFSLEKFANLSPRTKNLLDLVATSAWAAATSSITLFERLNAFVPATCQGDFFIEDSKFSMREVRAAIPSARSASECLIFSRFREISDDDGGSGRFGGSGIGVMIGGLVEFASKGGSAFSGEGVAAPCRGDVRQIGSVCTLGVFDWCGVARRWR